MVGARLKNLANEKSQGASLSHFRLPNPPPAMKDKPATTPLQNAIAVAHRIPSPVAFCIGILVGLGIFNLFKSEVSPRFNAVCRCPAHLVPAHRRPLQNGARILKPQDLTAYTLAPTFLIQLSSSENASLLSSHPLPPTIPANALETLKTSIMNKQSTDTLR